MVSIASLLMSFSMCSPAEVYCSLSSASPIFLHCSWQATTRLTARGSPTRLAWKPAASHAGIRSRAARRLKTALLMSSFGSSALSSIGTPRSEHSASKSSIGSVSQIKSVFNIWSISSRDIPSSTIRPDCAYAASSSASPIAWKISNWSTNLHAITTSPTLEAWKPCASHISNLFTPMSLFTKADLCSCGESSIASSSSMIQYLA
mmetsp:Transcript_71238/g.170599  ORF Transcript_71238/g.170599 Transcript_71238/m.170599 type:complete len:205 (+) Transcript_71238:1278-1892(+)